jgi:hypothetical protein
MKRLLAKTVGWCLFLLGIVVFLLPGPIRKGDYAAMARDAVGEYRAENREAAKDKLFETVDRRVERLAEWTQAMERAFTEIHQLCGVVIAAAGLFIIHTGSWIPKPPE